MIVESKEKERQKEKESQKLRKASHGTLLKRSLAATGSLVSMILGTYLIA